MLADCFAFPIRVGREIDSVSFFCGLLQFRNDPLIVSFLRVGDEFVRRLEIVFDVDSESF